MNVCNQKESRLKACKTLKENAQKRWQAYQQQGMERAKTEDVLYIAGCMLYWGEGEKSTGTIGVTNSDVRLLQVFLTFLVTYFPLTIEDMQLRICCYTDVHSQQEIETYWLTSLGLPKSCLKDVRANMRPKSSTGKSQGKSPYGTCSLRAFSTAILQEIYGALSTFGFEHRSMRV
jgi:hypothetical protein